MSIFDGKNNDVQIGSFYTYFNLHKSVEFEIFIFYFRELDL